MSDSAVKVRHEQMADYAEHPYLRDLMEILLKHPSGLRRWSVMRAMRMRCQKKCVEVSMKLEDDVERVFRRFCADEFLASDARAAAAPDATLFYRPRERAGEVWAVDADRARGWLSTAEPELSKAALSAR